MITRIRDVRRSKGLTLDEVAQRCEPPTTPQTIGRLETGTRTVSVGWLNRIAKALAVDASDLVETSDGCGDLPVAAIVGAAGAEAPRRTSSAIPPRPKADQGAVTFSASVGA
jgi:transcriptional regulator with XRE-family HTH domain